MLQVEMGSRFILQEEKQLLSQRCIYLWGIPSKYNNVWLIEVVEKSKLFKWIIYRDTTQGKLYK